MSSSGQQGGVADAVFMAIFTVNAEAAVMACDEMGIEPMDLLYKPKSLFSSDKDASASGAANPAVQLRFNMWERKRQELILKVIETRQEILAEGDVKEKWKQRTEEDPDAPGIPFHVMYSGSGAQQQQQQRPSLTPPQPTLKPQAPATARRPSASMRSDASTPLVPVQTARTIRPPRPAPICKNRTPEALVKEQQFLEEAADAIVRYIQLLKQYQPQGQSTIAPQALQPVARLPSSPKSPKTNQSSFQSSSRKGSAFEPSPPPKSIGQEASNRLAKLPRISTAGPRRQSSPAEADARLGSPAAAGISPGLANRLHPPSKSAAQRQVEVLIRNTMLNIANQAIEDERWKLLNEDSPERDRTGTVSPSTTSMSMAQRSFMGTPGRREPSYRELREKHLLEVRSRDLEERDVVVNKRLAKLKKEKKSKHVIPSEARKVRQQLAAETREQRRRMEERRLEKLLEKYEDRQRRAAEEEYKKKAIAKMNRLSHDQLSMLRQTLSDEVVLMRQQNEWGVPSVVKDTFSDG